MKKYLSSKTYVFYFAMIALAFLSMLFTNIGYDSEYQLAMGYRMLKGDFFLTQMWEPHQTSAFLCAMIMKLYLVITGTTTGIVLFTQFCGLFIRIGIGLFLFKIIKDLSGETPAFISSAIYLLVSPKDLLTPEFSNMQLWFGTLLFLLLIQYFKTAKHICLILAAVCLCFGIFSYPSFIIAYFAVTIILYVYSKHRIKDIAIFTCVCALIGFSFVGYLLFHIDMETMLHCLDHALSLEPTHTISFSQKLLDHIGNLVQILGVLLLINIFAFAGSFIWNFIFCKTTRCHNKLSFSSLCLASWYILQFFFLLNILSVENRGGYGIPLLFIVILGFYKRKLLTEKEKAFYYSALGIGFTSLISTLFLSDHPFLQAIPYMLTTVCASVLPLYHWYKQMQPQKNLAIAFSGALHIFLLLNIFRALFIHVPIHGRSQICSLLDDLALIRSGPAFGIITNEEGAVRQRDSMLEWKEYINPNDILWLIGEPVDTLGYLYENVEVGAPTVMSTPTYNEQLLYYWELNPDKYPTVIALASSYGQLSFELQQNEWLLPWLEEEYLADSVIEGNYWRYYIKRDNK